MARIPASGSSAAGRPDLLGSRDSAGNYVEFDRYIDAKLRQTRQQVRSVDIAGCCLALAAGTLAYFLMLALVDHWVVPGGLGLVGRWLALVVYIVVALTYIGRTLLPLCIRRINPVYAAQSIERAKPNLKNSLINFLLLRANPTGLTRGVYEAIEEQAATSLSRVPIEAAVDRSKLIKIGYVLLAVLLAGALYKVISPKDPLRTVGRVMLPWADIDPPTRVRIVAVEPGDAEVLHGARTKIKVEVQGPVGAEGATIYYNTDDGQVVNQSVPMQAQAEGYFYECELPPSEGGIQQDLTYRIEAGDAVSRNYRLHVRPAPTIVVQRVDYDYPAYTELLHQSVDNLGDLKAIEGTQVTLHATTNQPIKEAAIDFDCDGKQDQRMTFKDQEATVTFPLALAPDRRTPEHASYQLRFTNLDGLENPEPIRHQIEVTADVAPEIEFLAPRQQDLEVPLDAGLDCELVASDPDFGLAKVAVSGMIGGKSRLEMPLTEEIHNGQFRQKFRLVPKKHGLKVGDVLEYWGWAEDTKSPAANHTETAHRRLRVISPVGRPQPDQFAQNDPRARSRHARQNPDEEHQPQDEDRSEAQQRRNKHREQQPREGQGEAADQDSGQADQSGTATGQEAADEQEDSDKNPRQGASHSKERKGASARQREGAQEPGQEQDEAEQGGKEGQQGADKQRGAHGQQDVQRQQHGEDQQAEGGQGAEEQGGKGQPGTKQQPGEGKREADQQKGEQPDGRQDRGQSENESVAKDGSNDGEAFEKILKRQQKKQQKGRDQAPDQEPDQKQGGQAQGDQPQQDEAEEDEAQPQDAGNQKGKAQQKGKQKVNRQQQGKQQEEDGQKGSQQEDQPGGQKGKQKGQQQGGQSGGEQQDGNQKGAKQKGADQGGAEQGGAEQSGADQGQAGADEAGSEQGGNEQSGNEPKGGAKANQGKGQEDATGQSSEGDPSQQGKSKGKQPAGGADQPKGTEQAQGDKGDAQPKGTKSKQGKTGQQEQGVDSTQTPTGQTGSTGQPKSKGGQNNTAQSKTGQQQQQGQSGQSEQNTGEETQAGTEQSQTDAQGEPRTGQGAKSQGTQQGAKQTPDGSQQPEAKGGDGEQDKGQSGAGKEGKEDKQGSPSSQGANQQRNKTPGAQTGAQKQGNSSPSSPSISERQSDSQAEQGGERSGGGQEGGGQQANKSGTGGAGQNTGAEEGEGAASEQGKGETGEGAGSDQQAEGKTGQSGKSTGKGSTSRPKGEKSGDSKSQADQSKADGQTGGSGGGGQGGNSPADRPGGAPQGKGSDAPDGAKTSTAPHTDREDEANLDFSRKATELAIERLRHQLNSGQVDQEMLDEFQWTKEDLERFVGRYEAMFRQAKAEGDNGERARRELDSTLRSLGLRPRTSQVKSNLRDDTTRGMKETRRTRPPAEYLERARAYTQGTSRTRSATDDHQNER